MDAIAYLNFDGVAEQAIEFYSEALQATEVKKVNYKDFPQDPSYPLPENELNMIMESSIEFADGKIMMSDLLTSMRNVTGELVKGNNVWISLVNVDKQKLERYFNKLSVDGHVIMPLSNTPWSSCFGMLVDRFGVGWKFNCDADMFLDQVISNRHGN
ncbi:VOC family protein [Salipaludibacillus agaradhaerens]|jgi:PhnB protein|uniref:VOC family protein n=1 Tax=Salipaludibacillus agaradhaerens TaxID=76935 RepID=A0A9Q4G0T1_SALAG|nr:VOC family protein [Salipaludibacillus agaradhaerens]MCR6098836.1 VOC family protein [Salipaludibacillus agaradhaerens]MCR6115843.1 VOC family protein [Salipaludibacillus agaradhaerens]